MLINEIKSAVEKAEGQPYQAGGLTSVLQSILMNKERQKICYSKHDTYAKWMELQNTTKCVNWC